MNVSRLDCPTIASIFALVALLNVSPQYTHASAPMTVIVTPGDAQITVKWEPVPGAASYHVKRGSALSGPTTFIASNVVGTAHTEANLRNGTTYYYAVSAVSEDGESPDSVRLRAVPSAPVLDLLAAGAKVEKLAQGFQFIEGPVWIPDEGGFLVFSDINANRLIKWTPSAGATTFRRSSGQANGNTLDLEGRLLTCEHANRRITRTERDGTILPLVTEYGGKRFNAPNDVVVKSDGTVWFTDPDYGPGQLQPGRFVYRFRPTNGNATVTLVARGFDQPNGLCFAPDEKKLYVADSGGPRHVRVFDVLPDNTLTNSRVFTVISSGVPDGMRTDAAGRLFSSAGDGVHVFSPEGQLLARIRTPESAANVGFGGTNREMLFITANTALYGITRQPDLVVTGVNRFPASAVEGQSVRFIVTVKNQGTGPTPAGPAIHVGLTINGQTNVVWADGFAKSLDPDASVTLFCDRGYNGGAWTAVAGLNTLIARVDGSNRFVESNEGNNFLSAPFSAAPVPLDADSDGLSDSDEAVAGTEPNAAGSTLRILSATRPTPDSLSLNWTSVAGKSYRIAIKNGVEDLEWSDLPDLIVAQSATSSWTGRVPTAASFRLFRVRVVP